MRSSEALLLVALLAAGPSTAADLLYRQDPANDAAFLASAWHAPDGADEDQFTWDDFRLEHAASIVEIRWYGGYEAAPEGTDAVAVQGFTVSIFADASGGAQPDLRGAALALYPVTGNAGETAVGTAGGATLYEYRFALPTPFVARAGTTYWLQIEATQAGPPTWGLARAISGNDRHFRKQKAGGETTFQASQGDASFNLTGSAVAATTGAAPAPRQP